MKKKELLSTSSLASLITQEAEQCVKCALCSTVCPTYQLTHHESESPRGRIALAQGLAEEKIPLTQLTRLHLDQCLSCRACEAICPAGVKYGDLFDHTQALLKEKNSASSIGSIHWVKRIQKWRPLLRFYQKSGLQKIARRLGFWGLKKWRRYDALLPILPKAVKWQTFYPALGAEKGQVALFPGCLGKSFDQDTLLAAIHLLTATGYGVHLPSSLLCCGALEKHTGDVVGFQREMQKNQRIFEALMPLKAILFLASGCGVVLQPTLAERVTLPPVREISEFLATESRETFSFQSSHQTVILHTPCTLKNGLKGENFVKKLLNQIPKLVVLPLPADLGCCGAAGHHMVDFPQQANALVEKILEKLPILASSGIVLTSNIGCQLHLNRAFQHKKIPYQAIHPIRFLADVGFVYFDKKSFMKYYSLE